MKWTLFFLLFTACSALPLPLSDKETANDSQNSKLQTWGFSPTQWQRIQKHDNRKDVNPTNTPIEKPQSQHLLTIANKPPNSIQSQRPQTSVLVSNHNPNTNIRTNDPHRTFLNTDKLEPTTSTLHSTTLIAKRYLRVLRTTQIPTNFLRRYAHEIVVVCLLLIIPVTLALVEILERIGLGGEGGIELSDMRRGRGRGMIRRGRRGKLLRKKRGKKGKISMDIECQCQD